MHLIMTTTLATAAAIAPAPDCSWAKPGLDPYRGDPVAVLSDFGLSDDTRAKLRALMAAHQPSDVVRITRDRIVGDAGAYDDLREMHSGHGRVCRGAVDRSAWRPGHVEHALVYCADQACVLVPLVCHNVSLVSRRAVLARDDGPIDIEPAAGPRSAAAAPAAPTDSAGSDSLPPDDGTFGAPPTIGPLGTASGGSGGGFPGPETGGDAGGGLVPVAGPPDVGPCCAVIGGPEGGSPAGPGVTPPAIPEPPVWTMLLAAWALLLTRRGRPEPVPVARSGVRGG